MFKNSLLILAALSVWAVSSFLNSMGVPGIAQVTDVMDLGGEALFASGILFIFIRMALGSHRASIASRSVNHPR